jgi:hypothetical protein
MTYIYMISNDYTYYIIKFCLFIGQYHKIRIQAGVGLLSRSTDPPMYIIYYN